LNSFSFRQERVRMEATILRALAVLASNADEEQRVA
jgi:hypothetical protein